MFKLILADLFLKTRKDHYTSVLRFSQLRGTTQQRQWFENSQFFSFLQNVAF